jgi:hypothetical protein
MDGFRAILDRHFRTFKSNDFFSRKGLISHCRYQLNLNAVGKTQSRRNPTQQKIYLLPKRISVNDSKSGINRIEENCGVRKSSLNVVICAVFNQKLLLNKQYQLSNPAEASLFLDIKLA